MTTPNVIAVNLLITHTYSNNLNNCLTAITALGEAGGPEAVKHLTELSKNEKDSNIQLTAIAALGRAGRLVG